MKALILEDEARAANRLKKLVESTDPTISIVQICETVRDAIDYIGHNKDLDLIFADIQLADGLSFEIFEKIEVGCPIIFTTAFDQYAIEAFKTNGIDYLLKPVDEVQLSRALGKMDRLSTQNLNKKILEIAHSRKHSADYKSRFMVKIGERIRSIDVLDVVAFYSMKKATFLFTGSGRSYVLDHSLDMLETLVDPSHFFRINRKYMVAISACSDMMLWKNSRLKINIPGTQSDDVIVARERVGDFKAWLDR